METCSVNYLYFIQYRESGVNSHLTIVHYSHLFSEKSLTKHNLYDFVFSHG